MLNSIYNFSYQIYHSIEELPAADAKLLHQAILIADTAYAPYSKFHVGAAALLSNGKTVTGTNQENASYPVTICAERSLLSTAATLYPNIAIKTMAITYHNLNGDSAHPISPCGMCRQSLSEYELRTQHPIRLILGGLTGKVYIIETASMLLPLRFTGEDLK